VAARAYPSPDLGLVGRGCCTREGCLVAPSLRWESRRPQREVKDAKEVHGLHGIQCKWHAHAVGDKGLIFARGFREAHVLLSWHVFSF
jgi:hypothetical protein